MIIVIGPADMVRELLGKVIDHGYTSASTAQSIKKVLTAPAEWCFRGHPRVSLDIV